MGCCLATLITELPARAAQANKATCAFLSKIERECDDNGGDDDHTTIVLQGGFVRFDDCAMTATATATAAPTCPLLAEQTRTKHAIPTTSSQQECTTPPAKTKKVAAKKTNQDFMPSRCSNHVLYNDKRSRLTKQKPRVVVLDLTASVPPKNPIGRKMKQKVVT